MLNRGLVGEVGRRTVVDEAGVLGKERRTSKVTILQSIADAELTYKAKT